MKDDTVYLRHIQECIRRIEENVTEGRDHFLTSHTLQDAVLRNLQTIAESTQRLSEYLKAAQEKKNPLREAAGLGIVFGTVAGLLARYLTGIKMMFPILILGCIIILGGMKGWLKLLGLIIYIVVAALVMAMFLYLL